jgi:hypothetical protein
LTWVGVVDPEGALVAIFTTLVAGLAGVAPALTIVVVDVVDVVAAGDAFAFGLPDEVVTLVGFTELIVVLVLEIVVEPPPELNEPPPELEAKFITGAALMVGDAVVTTALEKLGAVIAGITTGVILLAVVCGPMAAQGGPPGQPVMSNCPLTKLRL